MSIIGPTTGPWVPAPNCQNVVGLAPRKIARETG